MILVSGFTQWYPYSIPSSPAILSNSVGHCNISNWFVGGSEPQAYISKDNVIKTNAFYSSRSCFVARVYHQHCSEFRAVELLSS